MLNLLLLLLFSFPFHFFLPHFRCILQPLSVERDIKISFFETHAYLACSCRRIDLYGRDQSSFSNNISY
ncbi:hypothetical protein JHK87_042310 [Glycine soja]|nr:hypothetical protein JHK87_042310 [Glycine soja]